MRILITGIAGFIGSNLANKLKADRYDVIGIDNLITGSIHNIKDHNWILKDVCDDWSSRVGKVDQIYHLASPASPVAYHAHPVQTMLANSMGTYQVLKYASKHGARVLMASTSEVYGDPLEHPQKESYNGNVSPTGPRSCYDEGKRFAEALCMAMQDVDTRIIRIFNTYGPNMAKDDGRVIPNFINQALNKEPFTIYGDGSQTRSLCYVDDLLEGMQLVMNKGDHMPYNLGNNQEYTINQIARTINQLVNNTDYMNYKMLPLPQDDPLQRKPDLNRIKELGWQPSTDLVDGLHKTIDHFI